VNPQNFYWFVQNYSSLLQEDANHLIELERQFPYSQVIRHLIARVEQDLNLPGKDEALRQSAIFATDRAVLKSIMTAPRVERQAENIEEAFDDLPKPPAVDQASHSTIPKPEAALPNAAFHSADIYEEVERDLEQLSKSMHRFEEVVEQLENGAHQLPTGSALPPIERVELIETELIEQIKSSKQQIIAEDVKHSEQIEIIDQFIKTQPTINKLKPVSEPTDLTEKIELQETHIVSETLVEILLKQGKTEKAVEMLKKLIWKFPQKKAYFAARIEELKK
jgi:tetratricopeptide (TPR) repeat protein